MVLPLTASDLRVIAAALEPIETDSKITESPLIGRIEVYRPDGEDVVGHFVREGNHAHNSGDAWFGFVMNGEQS